MNLSISNIAWSAESDELVYEIMKKNKANGLEIAPTRIFSENPYDKLEAAQKWAAEIKKKYRFSIPSMQSIWYGRQESIFGSPEDRRILFEYTVKAIDFAAAIGCKNLVFGCPRNRNMPEGADETPAVKFFRSIGDYAAQKGTVIGMEANPPIYNTNYINTTAQALSLIEKVDSQGFRLNLDVGTMIHNEESCKLLRGKSALINHVHISEPHLKPICERQLHKELLNVLFSEGYNGFISIEMGKCEDITVIEEKLNYLNCLAANIGSDFNKEISI